MYYFIPAWFKNNERSFYNVGAPWYREGGKIEFDDSINQIKMFEQAGKPVKLLLIGYMPSLRSFLQRQELSMVEHFSIFDELQGIQLRGMRRVMVDDLAFPAGAEYVYNAFRIIVYYQNEVYATVEIGSLGEILEVDFATKKYIFDDRGFLSSILYTELDGTQLRQDYLDLAGQVRFSEDLTTGKVTITPKFQAEFEQAEYAGIKDLVTEKFQHFLRQVDENDAVILAAGGVRTKLALELIHGPKVVMSYFTGRNQELAPLKAEPVAKADLAVADTQATADLIADLYPPEQIKVVTPFDTRLRLGHSQRLVKEILLFLVGDLAPETLDQGLEQLLTLMRDRPKLVLEVGVFRRSERDLHALRRQILEQAPDFRVTLPDDNDAKGENELQQRKYAGEVHLYYLDTENDLIKVLDRTRVLIDLGTPPDLYAQIAAISAGVPQIVLQPEQLVEHEKNGLCLQGDVERLADAIDHYTQGLRHWNEAMMYAVAKIAELTGGKLVRRWQKWLNQAEGVKK